MYNKQDSVFWWTLDDYVKNNPDYKNLTIEQKKLIEQGFRLAYYGLFQYQIYIGRELRTIEPTKIQEISNYIIENFEDLYLAVYKNSDKKDSLDLSIDENKKRFVQLLEDLIIPYINDHSFRKIDDFPSDEESIKTLVMQLLFKNKYDVNYKNKDNEGELYYSPIYPYLMTVLIVDPTNPMKMMDNVRRFFKKEIIEEAYKNGRLINEKEEEYLSSNLDRIRNEEDFNSFIYNFAEDKWTTFDISTRFRMIFQLSKYVAIILKERINNIAMLEDGDNIYDVIECYLPIILSSPKEIRDWKKNDVDEDNEEMFLYPISIKDFDPKTIEEYYHDMGVKIKIEDNKLEAFIRGVIYSMSEMRLIYQTSDSCSIISNYFISKNKIAFINSLKLYEEYEPNKFKKNTDYIYRIEEVFLDSTSLSNLIKNNKAIKTGYELEDKMKIMLMTISFLISLDPSIVKKMDYSLDEIVKYYMICFGPYKKTKIGYDKTEIKSIITIIKKITKYFEKKSHDDKNTDYYATIYLIDKLINFVKK